MSAESNRNVTVLLVEDNRFDVLLFEEAIELHQLPINLKIASDGERACELLEQAAKDPEAPLPRILVLDLNLPRRSGREVLERTRAIEALQTLPVLVVTSSDLSAEREELAKLGVKRYFTKPTSYDEFLKVGEVLKQMLAESDGSSRPSV